MKDDVGQIPRKRRISLALSMILELIGVGNSNKPAAAWCVIAACTINI